MTPFSPSYHVRPAVPRFRPSSRRRTEGPFRRGSSSERTADLLADRARTTAEKPETVGRARLSGQTQGRFPPVTGVVPTGHGQLLPTNERSNMEAAFGHDFGGVRVHSGPEAARMAQALGARAYSYGRNIVVGRRESLYGRAGRPLLAHELAHVVLYDASDHAVVARKEVPGPDGRTDEEIRRELELRSGVPFSELVLRLRRGPINITPRKLEAELRKEGIRLPTMDTSEPVVIDEVLVPHEYQDRRFVTQPVIGRASAVDRAKEAGQQTVRDAYVSGAAEVVQGTRAGARSNPAYPPAHDDSRPRQSHETRPATQRAQPAEAPKPAGERTAVQPSVHAAGTQIPVGSKPAGSPPTRGAAGAAPKPESGPEAVAAPPESTVRVVAAPSASASAVVSEQHQAESPVIRDATTGQPVGGSPGQTVLASKTGGTPSGQKPTLRPAPAVSGGGTGPAKAGAWPGTAGPKESPGERVRPFRSLHDAALFIDRELAHPPRNASPEMLRDWPDYVLYAKQRAIKIGDAILHASTDPGARASLPSPPRTFESWRKQYPPGSMRRDLARGTGFDEKVEGAFLETVDPARLSIVKSQHNISQQSKGGPTTRPDLIFRSASGRDAAISVKSRRIFAEMSVNEVRNQARADLTEALGKYTGSQYILRTGEKVHLREVWLIYEGSFARPEARAAIKAEAAEFTLRHKRDGLAFSAGFFD
ncbi:eCIS core domain-containing protein [Streptomyces bobili]